MTLSCGVNDVWHGAEKLNAIAAKANKSLSQLFTEFLNEKKAAMLKE